MTLASKITGSKELVSALNRLESSVTQAMIEGLEKAAIKIHESAVKGIMTQSMGRRYGNHIASRPGDPPNTDTGRLVGSVRWELDTQSLTASVGSNLGYAVDLEFGTSRMAPRPWLAPAVRQNERTLWQLFKLKTG